MKINGRYITETVLTVECHEQIDLDAYWNLDFDGTVLPRGEMPTLLYDKVAWPTVVAAQEQFRFQELAREAERQKPRRKKVNAP